jgi:Leucine-rich repeat (LRR) protein
MKNRLPALLAGLMIVYAAAASAAVSQSERDALVALYNSTNGSAWVDSAGWLGSAGTECDWFGVTCSGDGSAIVGLTLIRNGLAGSLPPELGNLGQITNLSLAENQLTGDIPAELWGLDTLLYLSLSFNELTGAIPESVGNLASLTLLDLGHNRLTGAIPAAVTSLTSLQNLSLHGNRLSGTIPDDIGNLTNLVVLSLFSNELEGTIPDSVGNLVNLFFLDIEENRLTGDPMPASIGNLANLEFLKVSQNDFNGPLPASVGNLAKLKQLSANRCGVTGEIPAGVANLSELRVIDIFSNRITGELPTGIGELRELVQFNVSGNRMTGEIPSGFENLTKLEWVYFALNDFTGTLPFLGNMSSLKEISFYGNNFSGSFPAEITSLSNLRRFSAGLNRLTGELPAGLGNLTNLDEFSVNANQLSGTIPAEIGSMTSLERLDLTSNLFSGSLPATIGNLTKLRGLGAAKNQLRGNVPREILNLTAEWIDLSDQGLTADPDVAAFLDNRGLFSGSQTITPTDFRVESTSAFTVTLAWTPIEWVFSPSGYQVLASTTPGGPYTPLLTTPDLSAERAIVPGLDPLTTYYFVVKAVTYPHGGGGYYQLNTIFSDPTPEVSAMTTEASASPAEILVTARPGGLVQAPGVGGGTDSFSLTNVGGESASVTITQADDFYSVSPGSFAIGPGGTQVVTLSGEPRTEGLYQSFVTILVDGLEFQDITVTLFVAESSRVDAQVSAAANRLDLVAPEGVDPSGTITYVNSGTETFTGVLVSDVEFLEPQEGVVTIEPGASVDVSVSALRSKRPDASLLSGTQVGKVSLVTIPGIGSFKRPFDGSSTPSLVTVADTVKPDTESGVIPPLGEDEVALVIPHLGHVVGSVGEFLSDLSILNASGTGAISDLELLYRALGTNTEAKSASLGTLDTAHAVSLADVVKSVFDGTQEVGTLQIRTSAADALSVSANIFNSSDPAGNFGTSIPVFRSDRAAERGGQIFLTGLRKDDSGHSNLFIQESRGSATSARIEFLSAGGEILGEATAEVEAFGLTRLIDQASPGTVAARITNLGDGGLVAYATPVDRLSGDTWAVADWARLYGFDSSERLVVPVGGAVRGANNTDFRTDLAITNRCATVVSPEDDVRTRCPREISSGTLRYYPREGGVFEETIELGLLETVVLDDVIRATFGITEGTVGFLEFEPVSGDYAATSRTFNFVQETGATFGSTVPALGNSTALRAGQSKRIGDLKDSTRATVGNQTPATARTNFGLVETSGEPLTVRASVYLNDPRSLVSGTAAGSKVYELGPKQFLSVSNLVEAIVGPERESLYNDLEGVQVKFDVISATGSLMIYTSSVDNGTGDSILRTD